MSYLKKYFLKTPEQQRNFAAISFFSTLDCLMQTCPDVARSIVEELKDQRSHLKLIASENFSSLAVQLAMGNLLTDKYSEGTVGHRFYAGCEHVDQIEAYASEQLKEIFQADHAYVQPHSGADANLIAYWAILVQKVQGEEIKKLGKKSVDELTDREYEQIRRLMNRQKMMGLSLASGGHLTHGYRHNISSKMMQAIEYQVSSSGELDYAALKKQVKKVKPLILVGGYSAYPRKLNFALLREIADSVGAVLMVDMAHFAGLVAGKVFQGEFNPVPFAHVVTSTTHKTLRGPRGGFILCCKEFQEVINKGCPLVMGGPLPHVMAAKAVAFKEANSPAFCAYAQQIVKNAQALASSLMTLGAQVLTGGTDNHLVLVDVEKSFGLTGRQAETALRDTGLTVNRNSIPGDKNGPWYTSGIRLGTAAMTTLGMKEAEMKKIAEWIVRTLKNTSPAMEEKGPSRGKGSVDPKVLLQMKEEVATLLAAFPLYPELSV